MCLYREFQEFLTNHFECTQHPDLEEWYHEIRESQTNKTVISPIQQFEEDVSFFEISGDPDELFLLRDSDLAKSVFKHFLLVEKGLPEDRVNSMLLKLKPLY